MISVIMSIYNEKEEYLQKSIESILNQTFKDFEYIIIIDNPLNEDAINIVNKYSDIDKRIKAYINKKNIGLTGSLNRALSYVQGEYIARMDADDISEPNRFELQYKYLNMLNLDIVGSSLRKISESGEIINELTNKSFNPDTIKKLLMYDNPVAHPSWFLKKQVYDVLDGYREIKACEDYDFLLRAVKKNFRIGICDSITLNYRVNTFGISRTNGLRQMLTSDYLQRNIKRIESITQSEIDEHINKKISAESNASYEIAVKSMNEIFEHIKKGRYIYGLKLPFLLFESKYIMYNYKKIILMRFIKIKYK